MRKTVKILIFLSLSLCVLIGTTTVVGSQSVRPAYALTLKQGSTGSTVKKMQQKLAHGGFVIRSGSTSDNVNDILEFSLKLDSNPQFTASVLVAYARAVARLKDEGKTGCVTVFDIPLKYLSPLSEDEMRKHLL